MSLEEMTLAELFEESDRVGDKYLTDEEVASRESQLQAARERVDAYEQWFAELMSDLGIE